MRISTRRGWVAITYLLLGAVNGQAAGGLQGGGLPSPGGGNEQSPVNTQEGDLVSFEPAQFNGNRWYAENISIFVIRAGLPRVFSWATQDFAAVHTIELWHSPLAGDKEKLIASQKVSIVNDSGPSGDTHGQSPDGPATTPNGLNKMVQGTPATATSPSNTGVTARSNLDIGQTKGVSGCEDLLYDAQHYGGGGSVNIDLQIIALCANKPDQKIVFHPGEPLYFRAVWEHKSATGLSYSRAFTTVGEDEQIIEHARGQSIYSALSPFKPASYSPNTQDGTSPSGGTQSPGVDEALNPSSTNGSGSSTSRTGLELGAIIGIAVGCGLAGLLAVLGIIWFIVRRRQQKQDLLPVGSFNSDNRGDDLMAEKEARTGVDVDASPNSPYSDDGHANGAYPPGTAVITTAAAAIPPHQDQSRSYTPYSDRPGAAAGATPSIRTDSIAQNDEGARANVPSPIPGRATPRGLTTPYAHLVEEGMTEEEIRRLEEEERQLDAAIEQAGRR